MRNIYTKFQLDKVRGFLPAEDPIQTLPEYYAPWDRLAKALPELLLAGILRREVAHLPELSTANLRTPLELERAMLVLSFVSHAYLRGESLDVNTLPTQLAIPWYSVAQKLGRPPILAHASAVLNNWRRINPDKPISLENLTLMQAYQGGQDEAWFFLVTTMIEYEGGKVISGLIEICENGKNEAALQKIVMGIDEMTNTIKRMPEKCDPYIFYHRLRPFLASFESVSFAGVEIPPLNLPGGSAAQSSLVQSIDAALGIAHLEASSGAFLLRMRDFMPPAHKSFLIHLEQSRPLQNLNLPTAVKLQYLNEIKQSLAQFRTAHLKIFHRYVSAQQRKSPLGNTGTGGTDANTFLKQTLNDTKNFKK